MLTDGTSTITVGIETTFPKATQGTSQQPENHHQCDILFSTTHTMQIWNRNITDHQTRRRMTQALHCRTRLGYEYMIKKAISRCDDSTTKQYIMDDCVVGMEQWALWARQESPFLLQVTSLSVLDEYHHEIKRLSPVIYGLVGKSEGREKKIVLKKMSGWLLLRKQTKIYIFLFDVLCNRDLPSNRRIGQQQEGPCIESILCNKH
jgi:hypothetical protein